MKRLCSLFLCFLHTQLLKATANKHTKTQMVNGNKISIFYHWQLQPDAVEGQKWGPGCHWGGKSPNTVAESNNKTMHTNNVHRAVHIHLTIQ